MISFKIDSNLKENLTKIAKEKNRSLSNLIETVLFKFVEQHKESGKKAKK